MRNARTILSSLSVVAMLIIASTASGQCVNGVCKIPLRAVAKPQTLVRAPLDGGPVQYQAQGMSVAPRVYRTPIRTFLFGRADYPTPLRSKVSNCWIVTTYRRQ